MNSDTTSDSHTWTSSNNYTVQYFADAEILRAVERVKRMAAKWKRDCCGKKTGKRHCDGYGCASIEKLVEPLKNIRRKRK